MRQAGLAALGLMLAAGPALAHHSAAMFDRTKKVTVTGVVKDFQYTQPHSWIDVNVPEPKGKTVEWSFEGGTPGQMKAVGLSPSTLKSGDKVTITGYPLRDGRPGAAFLEVTLPNGQTVTTRPPTAPPPTPAP
ncbi:MAG: DUF6152 family protein [Caulobacteraceae bacterium]